MKTKKMFFHALTALLFTAFILSCKKEKVKEETNSPSCKIVAATMVSGSGTATVNITYNGDKKISTLSMSGSYPINRVFNYNGTTIIINSTTTGGAFEGRDSVTVDEKGRPINIRHFYNQAGTSWHNTKYEYIGDDMVKFMQGYDFDNTLDTYTVNSTAGNVVYFGNSGNSTSLEYYADKSLLPGDYLEFTTLIQHGVSIYPRKNLVKRLDSGLGNYTDISYEFDSDEKISKLTATSGVDVITFTSQYQCD